MNLSAPAILKKQRTGVLLLTLLIALATSFANAHVHSSDPSAPTAYHQIKDCALCHAGVAFTFEANGWSQAETFQQDPAATWLASAALLGYRFRPESRAPPAIS